MSTFDKLLEIFQKVFEDEVDISEITEESHIINDLGMNSIGMLYMAMAVEEEFGVKFSNSDFEELHTVKDIIRRIEG